MMAAVSTADISAPPIQASPIAIISMIPAMITTQPQTIQTFLKRVPPKPTVYSLKAYSLF